MKFFVPSEIYEDRISICKGCKYYISFLGNCGICKCFMKVKARIAPMECPKGYWQKTTEVKTPTEIPQDLIDEIIELWPDLKTGVAKNQHAKTRMIETYNAIYNANYNTHTNCGSCISTCFDAIKRLYEKYK